MTSALSDEIRDLPAPVARVIQDVVESAIAALGDTLRSIVLFGSGAENRLRATSDVNLLVVLTRFDSATVESMTGVLQRAHAAVRLSVMWLTEDEIPSASEAFAVKFADIARRHRVLVGLDPFDGLAISRQAAITRLRQVLLNTILRLRASYALECDHDERLTVLLADAAAPLRACAAEILDLEGRPAPSAREALELLASQWSPARAAAVLQSFRVARETRQLEPGSARAIFLEVIDLGRHLYHRVLTLS